MNVIYFTSLLSYRVAFTFNELSLMTYWTVLHMKIKACKRMKGRKMKQEI